MQNEKRNKYQEKREENHSKLSGLGKTEYTWGYIIELKLTLRKLSDNDVVYIILCIYFNRDSL